MRASTFLEHGGLPTKAAAALIGRSVHTLQHGRSDRYDLNVPPSLRVGRIVVYPLDGVLAWAKRTGRPLHWQDMPVSVALPVFAEFEAQGIDVPIGLRAALARVRRGRP